MTSSSEPSILRIADPPSANGIGGHTTTRKSYASKNLNAYVRPPSSNNRLSNDTTRYGGGRLLVLGKGRPSGAAVAPVPINTPSLRSENNGQDIHVTLVPTGAPGWGAGREESTTSRDIEISRHKPILSSTSKVPWNSAEQKIPKRQQSENTVENTSNLSLIPSEFPDLGAREPQQVQQQLRPGGSLRSENSAQQIRVVEAKSERIFSDYPVPDEHSGLVQQEINRLKGRSNSLSGAGSLLRHSPNRDKDFLREEDFNNGDQRRFKDEYTERRNADSNMNDRDRDRSQFFRPRRNFGSDQRGYYSEYDQSTNRNHSNGGYDQIGNNDRITYRRGENQGGNGYRNDFGGRDRGFDRYDNRNERPNFDSRQSRPFQNQHENPSRSVSNRDWRNFSRDGQNNGDIRDNVNERRGSDSKISEMHRDVYQSTLQHMEPSTSVIEKHPPRILINDEELAEEARRVAEREHKLAQHDEVETAAALQARQELEQLKAEKERKAREASLSVKFTATSIETLEPINAIEKSAPASTQSSPVKSYTVQVAADPYSLVAPKLKEIDEPEVVNILEKESTANEKIESPKNIGQSDIASPTEIPVNHVLNKPPLQVKESPVWGGEASKFERKPPVSRPKQMEFTLLHKLGSHPPTAENRDEVKVEVMKTKDTEKDSVKQPIQKEVPLSAPRAWQPLVPIQEEQEKDVVLSSDAYISQPRGSGQIFDHKTGKLTTISSPPTETQKQPAPVISHIEHKVSNLDVLPKVLPSKPDESLPLQMKDEVNEASDKNQGHEEEQTLRREHLRQENMERLAALDKRRRARAEERAKRPPRTSGALYKRGKDRILIFADGESDPYAEVWNRIYNELKPRSTLRNAPPHNQSKQLSVPSIEVNLPAPPIPQTDIDTSIPEETKIHIDREQLREERRQRKKDKRLPEQAASIRKAELSVTEVTTNENILFPERSVLAPEVKTNEEDASLLEGDEGEFEVVKSRRTRIRESREQREERDRLAAQAKAEELAAARKAARKAEKERIAAVKAEQTKARKEAKKQGRIAAVKAISERRAKENEKKLLASKTSELNQVAERHEKPDIPQTDHEPIDLDTLKTPAHGTLQAITDEIAVILEPIEGLPSVVTERLPNLVEEETPLTPFKPSLRWHVGQSLKSLSIETEFGFHASIQFGTVFLSPTNGPFSPMNNLSSNSLILVDGDTNIVDEVPSVVSPSDRVVETPLTKNRASSFVLDEKDEICVIQTDSTVDREKEALSEIDFPNSNDKKLLDSPEVMNSLGVRTSTPLSWTLPSSTAVAGGGTWSPAKHMQPHRQNSTIQQGLAPDWATPSGDASSAMSPITWNVPPQASFSKQDVRSAENADGLPGLGGPLQRFSLMLQPTIDNKPWGVGSEVVQNPGYYNGIVNKPLPPPIPPLHHLRLSNPPLNLHQNMHPWSSMNGGVVDPAMSEKSAAGLNTAADTFVPAAARHSMMMEQHNAAIAASQRVPMSPLRIPQHPHYMSQQHVPMLHQQGPGRGPMGHWDGFHMDPPLLEHGGFMGRPPVYDGLDALQMQHYHQQQPPKMRGNIRGPKRSVSTLTQVSHTNSFSSPTESNTRIQTGASLAPPKNEAPSVSKKNRIRAGSGSRTKKAGSYRVTNSDSPQLEGVSLEGKVRKAGKPQGKKGGPKKPANTKEHQVQTQAET